MIKRRDIMWYIAWYILLVPIVLIGLPAYYHDWSMLAVTIPISLFGWWIVWLN